MKKDIKDYVRTIPDFPEKGIMFRDITTILGDADGLHLAVSLMEKQAEKYDFDIIVGPESRGFIFGVPIAYNLYKPFAPIRKKGKLPGKTVQVEYGLEYGKSVLEIHKDAIKKGQKVLIVDDLMATGGTIDAIVQLVESLGGEVVAGVFLMELKGLNGREKFKNFPIETIIAYEGK